MIMNDISPLELNFLVGGEDIKAKTRSKMNKMGEDLQIKESSNEWNKAKRNFEVRGKWIDRYANKANKKSVYVRPDRYNLIDHLKTHSMSSATDYKFQEAIKAPTKSAISTVNSGNGKSDSIDNITSIYCTFCWGVVASGSGLECKKCSQVCHRRCNQADISYHPTTIGNNSNSPHKKINVDINKWICPLCREGERYSAFYDDILFERKQTVYEIDNARRRIQGFGRMVPVRAVFKQLRRGVTAIQRNYRRIAFWRTAFKSKVIERRPFRVRLHNIWLYIPLNTHDLTEMNPDDHIYHHIPEEYCVKGTLPAGLYDQYMGSSPLISKVDQLNQPTPSIATPNIAQAIQDPQSYGTGIEDELENQIEKDVDREKQEYNQTHNHKIQQNHNHPDHNQGHTRPSTHNKREDERDPTVMDLPQQLKVLKQEYYFDPQLHYYMGIGSHHEVLRVAKKGDLVLTLSLVEHDHDAKSMKQIYRADIPLVMEKPHHLQASQLKHIFGNNHPLLSDNNTHIHNSNNANNKMSDAAKAFVHGFNSELLCMKLNLPKTCNYFLVAGSPACVEVVFTISQVTSWPKAFVVAQARDYIEQPLVFKKILTCNQSFFMPVDLMGEDIPATSEESSKMSILLNKKAIVDKSKVAFSRLIQNKKALTKSEKEEVKFVGGSISWSVLPGSTEDSTYTECFLLSDPNANGGKRKGWLTVLDQNLYVYNNWSDIHPQQVVQLKFCYQINDIGNCILYLHRRRPPEEHWYIRISDNKKRMEWLRVVGKILEATGHGHGHSHK